MEQEKRGRGRPAGTGKYPVSITFRAEQDEYEALVRWAQGRRVSDALRELIKDRQKAEQSG